MEPFEGGGVIDDDEARLVMGEDWPFFFLFFSRLDLVKCDKRASYQESMFLINVREIIS